MKNIYDHTVCLFCVYGFKGCNSQGVTAATEEQQVISLVMTTDIHQDTDIHPCTIWQWADARWPLSIVDVLSVIYCFSLFESLTTALSPSLTSLSLCLYLKPKTKHSIIIEHLIMNLFTLTRKETHTPRINICRPVCIYKCLPLIIRTTV